MMAPPGCPPGSMMMSCVVPPGFGPGMMIQVNTPAGLMNVPIPRGATPGCKFDFLVPAPPPRVAPPPPGEQIIKGDFDGDGVEDTMIIHGGEARIIHGVPPQQAPLDIGDLNIGEEQDDGKPTVAQPAVVAGFECGKYRIKTAGHKEGEQPAGWGLAAWQKHGGQRNGSSSRVAVHEGDHWPCDWEIKPGTQPGTYRIETCGHEEGGQPAGWGLAAWNNIEKRNDQSSWVYVHEGDEWPCDWEIKPGTEPGTYRIYCCQHDAGGQPAGWGLAAWNAHGAERNGSSSWIAVHEGDEWPCDWFLERVG